MSRIPPPRNAPPTIYHEILWTTEKEMERILTEEKNIVGLPVYGCVMKSGAIRVWPTPEQKKIRLFWTVAE